ncbi:FAD binding domain [Seminavis robusta]|uniref:FAD binding domain n=1 Tax=Seminavis robusta TaxID=568900 RepID=A0A9N8DQY8_9STRA|nr:FAD binding domain [Seminavis robusta]|eukprot:Sro308_g113530.1 FAD binding domain (436) ;mRNA; r:24946-26253
MKVLISGGGIAGLAAAITLLQGSSNNNNNLEVVILEKDASSEARIQGFSLGISPLGATALQHMNMAHRLVVEKQLVTPLGSNFCLTQHGGNVLLQSSSSSSASEEEMDLMELFEKGRTSINRGVLRQQMLQEISRDDRATILWSAKVVHLNYYTTQTQGPPSVQVTLEDGRHITGNVLLGCDGIFSKVRELLLLPPLPKLRHLGVAWVRGVCPEQGQLAEWFGDNGHNNNNKKSFTFGMTDPRGAIFLVECDKTNLLWYFAFPMKKHDNNTMRIDDREQILGLLVEQCRHWHPCVLAIIQDTLQCQGPMLFRHLYDRPPDHLTKYCLPDPSAPITLLGDALHPVASYALAGGGSNALSDGVDVAKSLLLVANSDNHHPAKALREYERPVLERSLPQARNSKWMTTLLHSGWLGGYAARIAFCILRGVLWLLGKSP